MRLPGFSILLTIVACVLGASTIAHAQVTTATLYGVVRDPGLRCVGGPVWNYTGEVVAAISVAALCSALPRAAYR